MSLYLGVDIGTTRTKVGCLDVDSGRLVSLQSARTPVEEDSWGGRRDAGAVVGLVRELVTAVLDDLAVDQERLAGLAVGSVGEEVVVLDAEGRATGPVLAWHADHGREAKRRRCPPGLEDLDDTFSVFKLSWLAHERPAEIEHAVTFTALADFVARALVQDAAGEVLLNVSHASRTGLLDLDGLTLREDVLPGLGLDRLVLPRLVPSGTVIGATDLGGRLVRDVPVVTGGHDHWCGAFGSGVRDAGDVYVSAGTSEAQVMIVDRVPDQVPEGIDVGAFVAGGLSYLHRATPSGRIYQAWRHMLYRDAPDEDMWREIAELPGPVGPAVVDTGRRTVQLAPLPLDATPAQAMTSLFAGLAVEAECSTTRLEALAGRAAGRVVVAGVPAGRPEWRRLRQDATARPLRFVPEPEVTVVGVALLAQLGVEGEAAHVITPTIEGLSS